MSMKRETRFIETAVPAFIFIVFIIMAVMILSEVSNDFNKINEGIIVDKQYEEEYMRYSSSKDGGYFYKVPECYYFTIEGEKDGNNVKYTFSVTKEEYEQYKIGDYFKR